MKHNLKITLILLAMFIITQLIGLAVINAYAPRQQLILNQTTGLYENQTISPELPYGFQPPEMQEQTSFTTILISMAIAIALIFLLMTLKARKFLRAWFFFVIAIALGITFSSFLTYTPLYYKFIFFDLFSSTFFIRISSLLALIITIPFAFIKLFRRNILVHNFTELLIYPGIAAVFAPLLGIWTAVFLLLIISVYDMWAVWHSGFMQKMAKFQMNELKVFGGFLIPYLGKKDKKELELLHDKYKSKIPVKVLKKKKIKINLAILGGGDVVFPLILAGVVFLALGFVQALMITLFSSISLVLLFILAKKGKFYPAMPFLTVGCLLGLMVAYLI